MNCLKLMCALGSEVKLIKNFTPLIVRCFSISSNWKYSDNASVPQGKQLNFQLPDLLLSLNRQQFSSQPGNFPKRIPIVTYDDIKNLPNTPEKILIDVREFSEVQETGKIPTSINIPLSSVAQALSAETDNESFKQEYGRSKPGNETEIIFHCQMGKRSQTAAEAASTLGFQNVKNYKGSWLNWAKREKLPK